MQLGAGVKMSKRVLILLEGSINGPLYVKAAEDLGLHPITLTADPARHDYLAVAGCEAVRIDTHSLDAMMNECSRLASTFEIAGITSGLESACAAAGKLCLHFNLPGPNHAAIERCRDKFAQRQLLARAGVPVPAYRLALNEMDISSSAAEIGLPVIVKPAVGIGSSGVRLCRDEDELTEHAGYLLGGQHMWRSSPKILVEEFARGPHYSVELMGNEMIGVGGADFGGPPHFVSREYIYPALLTDSEQRRITDLSLSCLQALGLGWGPANIDLRWTTRGPVVIEVNPRLAAIPIPQLIKLAYGVDLVTEHLKLAIGEECNLRRSHSHTAAARIFVPDRDGVLESIRGDDRAAALSGIAEVRFFIELNTRIVRKGDYRDKIGHVVAASPCHAQTKAILQSAVDFIDWSISPFPPVEGCDEPRLPLTSRPHTGDVTQG